jgi:hypothetical protein
LNEPLESNNPAETSVETSDETQAAQTKNRRKLVFLFAIAIVPMFVAYGLFFYFPDLIPASTTNEGVLIQPPLSGVTLGLTEPVVEPGGVWTMLIPVAATCGEQCQRRLYLSRQIKIGLGKDADRIERIALLSVDPSAELHALLTCSDLLISGPTTRVTESTPWRHGGRVSAADGPKWEYYDVLFLRKNWRAFAQGY